MRGGRNRLKMNTIEKSTSATEPPTVQKRTSLKILSEVITSKNRECCTSKNPALQSLVAD